MRSEGVGHVADRGARTSTMKSPGWMPAPCGRAAFGAPATKTVSSASDA